MLCHYVPCRGDIHPADRKASGRAAVFGRPPKRPADGFPPEGDTPSDCDRLPRQLLAYYQRAHRKHLAITPFLTITASLQAGGILKKTLALVMLAGLMLTGCGSKQASAQAETAKATAVAENTIEVPDVVGLSLDKATDQLKTSG